MEPGSKSSSEKKRTMVSRRSKVIISISAFILVFVFMVVLLLWFKIAQGLQAVMVSPGKVDATLLSFNLNGWVL